MDDLSEALTLIQTRKMRAFPIILMGEAFWRPLLDFIAGTMVQTGVISADDLKLITVTDDPQEVTRIIEHATAEVSSRPPPIRWSRLLRG